MTCKELLYVEDALGHECFMKTCSLKTSAQLTDANLSNYIKELLHTISAKFELLCAGENLLGFISYNLTSIPFFAI